MEWGGWPTGFIFSKENGNAGGKRKAEWLSRKEQPQLRELEGAQLVHPGLSWSKQAEIEWRRRGIDNWLCFLTVQEAFSELEKLNTVPHPGKSLCPSLVLLGGLL